MLRLMETNIHSEKLKQAHWYFSEESNLNLERFFCNAQFLTENFAMIGLCDVCNKQKHIEYDKDTVNQFICIDCIMEFDVLQAFA